MVPDGEGHQSAWAGFFLISHYCCLLSMNSRNWVLKTSDAECILSAAHKSRFSLYHKYFLPRCPVGTHIKALHDIKSSKPPIPGIPSIGGNPMSFLSRSTVLSEELINCRKSGEHEGYAKQPFNRSTEACLLVMFDFCHYHGWLFLAAISPV